MRQIFTVGRGHYDNIGDAILRRELLDWVRDAGRLHVFVGNSPDGYDDSLGLTDDDEVYRSLSGWYRAALADAVRGRADYVFKPGEIQLTVVGMKEHLVVLPLLVVARLRRGRVVRVGVGARSFDAPGPRALLWPSMALSNLTRWRDDATAAYLGHGGSMPDLAFGQGSTQEELAQERPRRSLVVSMRGDGDRPYPSETALAGLRRFAADRDLSIRVVTQVREDEELTHRLAADLGGQALGWPEGTSNVDQEEALRELYRHTAVAVSDRLHVVIAAYTEGAVPVAGLVRPAAKLERHLTTIGVHDVTVDLASGDADEVVERLKGITARRDELFSLLAAARTRLEGVRRLVLDQVGPRTGSPAPTASPAARVPGRPVVHHLGRVGEVAGGMTQVLNGYLRGPFDRLDVDVVPTRGNPRDRLASARLAPLAALRIARLPRTTSVVAAHLAAGGSFLREGALLRLADARGLATVAHLHGSSFEAFAARRPGLVRWVLGAADRVVSLSAASSEIAARTVPAERVHLVPNAVRLGEPAPEENLVVFGGQVGHRKGVDVLTAAWKQLDAPGWRLVIAGPVAEPGLVPERDDVDLLGSVPNEELLGLLERSRVAVLPSRDEAMPVFVLEAMARHNAVVATDVGGVAPVLGDGRGLVVPPGDVEALRAALQRVVSSDATEREALADAALQAARDSFSTDAIYPRVEQVWLDALQDRRSRQGQAATAGARLAPAGVSAPSAH